MTLRAEPRLDPPGDDARPAPTLVEAVSARKPDVGRSSTGPSRTGAGRSAEAAEDGAAAAPVRRSSPLTRRVLTLNILALAIPIIGLLYLDDYRDGLIETQLEALRTDGELFAVALAETGVIAGPFGEERLMPELARLVLRRMLDVSPYRARLFDQSGAIVADSMQLMGPGGPMQIELLPPLTEKQSLFVSLVEDGYEGLLRLLPGGDKWPLYQENQQLDGPIYPEVGKALGGDAAKAVYSDGQGSMVLSAAVPVQRYRQVLGALMLTTDGHKIDEAVRNLRFDILKVFGVALAVTILLSLVLAGTIARPIHRLAEAAERVRRGQGRQIDIPDFSRRRDEIGNLSAALRDMTTALWQRMDAIERFAADVAHEIKNPLTSLRSAVETVSRIEDAEQQRRLMGIILDDVQRLDRLITDISDASRLDAELSRAEMAPVDVGRMLRALAELHEATVDADGPGLELDIADHPGLIVRGIEGRLVQVWRNLIGNAVSFSPPGGAIRVVARRAGRRVRVTIADEGPGIPPDKLSAIFERFYSERPRGEKFGTHSGLGLSISKQIVEAHGGRIVAENRTDADGNVRGALFTVMLPAA